MSEIIIEGRSTGGTLHLPDALTQYPDRGVVPYHRVSEYGSQTGGKGLPKLIEKANAIRDEIRGTAPGRLRRIPFYGVESGKVSCPRPCLVAAAEWANERQAILVAADLSRFIRAEDYHRRTNWDAWPSDEEFQVLRELTLGVPLATLAPPELTESERHSRATKRTARCGRPSALSLELKWKALQLLGKDMAWNEEPSEWTGQSEGQVAKQLGVSKSTLSRF